MFNYILEKKESITSCMTLVYEKIELSFPITKQIHGK